MRTMPRNGASKSEPLQNPAAVTHLFAWRRAFEGGSADNSEFPVRTGEAFSLGILSDLPQHIPTHWILIPISAGHERQKEEAYPQP
jgi:hypothetical protein